jgi:hypothetical protein
MDNLGRAATFIDEIETKNEISSLPYKNYVSFYRASNNVVEVLFIFNSTLNIKNILSAVEFSLN